MTLRRATGAIGSPSAPPDLFGSQSTSGYPFRVGFARRAPRYGRSDPSSALARRPTNVDGDPGRGRAYATTTHRWARRCAWLGTQSRGGASISSAPRLERVLDARVFSAVAAAKAWGWQGSDSGAHEGRRAPTSACLSGNLLRRSDRWRLSGEKSGMLADRYGSSTTGAAAKPPDRCCQPTCFSGGAELRSGQRWRTGHGRR